LNAAAAYLVKMPVAVAGQGGHGATFAAACKLVEFGLAPNEAWPLLLDYNGRCLPPWSESDLRHKLSDAFKEACPNPKFTATKPRKVSTPPPFDWQKCVASFTEADARKLSDWRGFSPDFVRWLHGQGCVGAFEGKVAFPNHGTAGQVVSCHVRLESGNWIFKPEGQSTAPLIFGDIAAAGFIMAFESQWDAFAVMDKLDWHATNGLPDAAVLITRGAGNGKLAKGRFSPDAVCYAFEQNDAPKIGKALSSAAQWTADLAAAAACKIVRVATPAPHADANDWTGAGATEADIRAAMLAAKPVRPATPPAQSAVPVETPAPEGTAAAGSSACKAIGLADLVPDVSGEQELIRSGFLRRGGGMLFPGPTGVGKSSFALQLMLSWAAGRECFGFAPTHALTSLLIQAENDNSDLIEMRDGVLAGLGFSEAERLQALAAVRVATVDAASGLAFLAGTVRPLVREHRPDVLWLDPLLSYLGGDVSKQEVVSGFLRNNLNPILHEFGCAVIILHHCNKPKTGQEKPDWKGSDFSYLGAGSAELANWARAIIAIRSLGSSDVFELRACKRGGRLGWVEDDGHTKRYALNIAHDKRPGVICWRVADTEEVPAGPGRTKSSAKTKSDLLAHVPVDGEILQETLIFEKGGQAGIGQKKARSFLDQLLSEKTIYLWKTFRSGTSPLKSISRHPQPESELPTL